MPQDIYFTIDSPNPDSNTESKERLDKACARICPAYSRTFWQNIISDGLVMVNGAICDNSAMPVRAGDTISAQIPEPIPAIPQPTKMDLDIIYEDKDIIIINKPVGLTVHPAPGHYDDTLVNGLLAYCADSLSGIGGVSRPGIVHRLDKDTSGLMVVAKNDSAHQKLSADFAIHAVKRKYIAIVHGIMKPANGTIDAPIGRDSKNRQKQAVVNDGRGKNAITHYKTMAVFDNFSVVECALETGRTHQVRVHLAHLGHPIIGDDIYGKKPKFTPNIAPILHENISQMARQALHAYQLHLSHPINGTALQFTAPLPPDMAWVTPFLN